MGCPHGGEDRCFGGERSGRNPVASQRGSTGLRIPHTHTAFRGLSSPPVTPNVHFPGTHCATYMKFKNSGWSNVSFSNVWHKRSLKLRFLLLFAALFIWVKQSICSKEYVGRILIQQHLFFTRLLKPIFSYTRPLKHILFLCHHVSGRYTHLRVFSHVQPLAQKH